MGRPWGEEPWGGWQTAAVDAARNITRMLANPAGAAELLPLVYEELRKLAGRQIAREQGAYPEGRCGADTQWKRRVEAMIAMADRSEKSLAKLTQGAAVPVVD